MPYTIEKHSPRIRLPDQIPTAARKNAKSAASLVTCAAILAAAWGFTEFVAWRLGFSAVLNDEAIASRIYYPWSGFLWLCHLVLGAHDAASRQDLLVLIVQSTALLVVALAIACALGILTYWYHIKSIPPVHDVSGSSQWAGAADFGDMELLPPGHAAIRAANTRAKHEHVAKLWRKNDDAAAAARQAWLETPGVYIGEWVDDSGARNWLRDTSDRHLGVIAPTRTGKGVSVGVPTCLSWTGSLVANDPKAELFGLSAYYRKHTLGQRIFVLDPTCTDGSASCFNFLDTIRVGTEYEISDTQNLANLLCDPMGLGETGNADDYWRSAAAEWFTALALHTVLSDDVPDKTLTGIDAFRSDPARSITDTCQQMLNACHDPEYTRGWMDFQGFPTMTHPVVAKFARNMLNRADKEQSGVNSSLGKYLELYTDPIIAANTNRSDFSVEDLMRADRPCTLYIIDTPDNMRRLRPYMRLLFNLIVTVFCGRIEFDEAMRPKPSAKWPLLLLCDEAVDTLGHMPILAQNLTFLAGYMIKVMLIMQNRSQMDDVYKHDRTNAILANLHTQIYYSTNDPPTQKQISDMTGHRTLRYETTSYGHDGKKSTGESITSRALLTPDEVRALHPSKELVFCAGHRPALLDRIIYYQEPVFTSRLHQPIEPDGSPLVCDRIPRNEQARTREAAPHVQKEILAAAARRESARERLAVTRHAPPVNTRPLAEEIG